MTMSELPLNGSKTYATGVAMIAYAILGLFLGYMEANEAFQLATTGFGIMALRHGIEKKGVQTE